VALALALALVAPRSTLAQPDPGWIGKRVVPARKDFTLEQQGQPAHRTNNPISIYVVERSEGARLWIKAEGNGPSGWAAPDQLVRVDAATEFFTSRIRAKPRDAFSYFMRAWIWQDKKEYDKAIADYTEAIRLDPNDARAFRNRG
jgi:tetratricopeptide (TPR) repeat protein